METIQPTRESISESIYASGIVKSRDQYQAYATVNGIVEKVLEKYPDAELVWLEVPEEERRRRVKELDIVLSKTIPKEITDLTGEYIE